MKLTDRFCEEHLDAEFRGLCRSMLAALVEAGVPLASRKVAGWAAAIVYSVGYVNFLVDPTAMTLTPALLSGQYAVSRPAPDTGLATWATGDFVSITATSGASPDTVASGLPGHSISASWACSCRSLTTWW